MKIGRTSLTTRITLIGSIAVLVILVVGTMLMGQDVRHDTEDAVSSVSLLYLDELAGRREQVVANNLSDNIRDMNIAIEMMDDDLSDLDHLRSYQSDIKRLFNLNRFAFVDEDGHVYTANEGIVDEIDQYSRKRNGLDAHLPHTRERNQQSHRVGNRWDRHP